MNRGRVVWGVITGVAVMTAIYFLWRKRRISGFKRRLIDNANREWELWGNPIIEYGTMVESGEFECSPIYKDRVGEYWKLGVNRDRDGCDRDMYWSSAFISFIMKKSGAGSDFPYGSAHHKYIRPIIQNRKEDNNSPFKGYRLSEKPLQLGDLICYSRESGVNYDTTHSYESHCDIVVKVNKSKQYAEVIGGNVSNGVTKKSSEYR